MISQSGMTRDPTEKAGIGGRLFEENRSATRGLEPRRSLMTAVGRLRDLALLVIYRNRKGEGNHPVAHLNCKYSG